MYSNTLKFQGKQFTASGKSAMDVGDAIVQLVRNEFHWTYTEAVDELAHAEQCGQLEDNWTLDGVPIDIMDHM